MTTLVLGVGDAQVDLIRHCKRLGHFVHGLSYRREGPGLPLVDAFGLVDILDRSRVAAYAAQNRADIVYSIGSDVAMPAVGHAAEKLGLPCLVGESVASLMQNKVALRQFLSDRGISPIPFREARKLTDLAGWDVFPAILKPVDSQGQRGVFEVRHMNDGRACFERSQEFSLSRTLIIEQYVGGSEVSCNAFVCDGKIVYEFLSDRASLPGLPGGIVKGHAMPARVGEKARGRLGDLVRRAIGALKIGNGPVYFQMKYDAAADQAWIIEIAPRLDGCHLWRLIWMQTGIDLLALTVARLAGEQGLKFPAPAASGERLKLEFFHQPPGSPFAGFRAAGDSLYEEFYYAPGDIVRPVNGVSEKVGYRIQADVR